MPSWFSDVGACDFCATEVAGLVEPADLRPYFELLAGIYVESADGEPLPVLLKRDWALFTNPKMTDYVAQVLLAEIFDDAEMLRKNYVLDPEFESSSDEDWALLSTELMHENRWFLKHPLSLDRLGGSIGGLVVDPNEVASNWYRARLVGADGPFGVELMGAPPPQLAVQGRANPAGIPYLYLATSEVTAVSEVRPHTGDSACVARFEVPSFSVVDLRDPRALASPFLLGGSDEVGRLLADLFWLEKLGRELKRPVIPRTSPFEYAPSQYFCEFIKSLDFDGVMYGSAVGGGTNLALFDPERSVPLSVRSVVVSEVRVAIEQDPLCAN